MKKMLLLFLTLPFAFKAMAIQRETAPLAPLIDPALPAPEEKKAQSKKLRSKNCQDIKGELKGLSQFILKTPHPRQKNANLLSLQKQYDKMMADYIILDGLKAIRQNYLNLQGQAAKAAAGDDKAAKEMQQLARAASMKDQIDPISKVLAVESYLSDLDLATMDTPLSQGPSDFKERFLQRCKDKGAVGNENVLCGMMAKGDRWALSMAYGYARAFGVASKKLTKAQKAQRIQDYKKKLMEGMPAIEDLQTQSFHFKELQKALSQLSELKNKLHELDKNSSDPEYRANYEKHRQEMEKLYLEFAQYSKNLTAKNPQLQSYIDRQKLEQGLGDIVMAKRALEFRFSNRLIKKEQLKKIMDGLRQNHQLAQKRLDGYGSGQKTHVPKAGRGSIEDFYKAFGPLRKKLCPESSATDAGLEECLSYLVRQDSLDDTIDKQLAKMKQVEGYIAEITDSEDYKKLAKMQTYLLQAGKNICQYAGEDLVIQTCEASGGVYGQDLKQIELLVDSSHKIVGTLMKDRPQESSSFESLATDMTALCKEAVSSQGGRSLASFSPSMCTIARRVDDYRSRPTYAEAKKKEYSKYYVGYDGRGREIGRQKRPGTMDFVAHGFGKALYETAMAFGQLYPNDAQIYYNYQMGIMQKQALYNWDQAQQQAWDSYYSGYNYGLPGAYPMGYVPGASDTFNGYNPTLYPSEAASDYYRS